MAQVEQGAFNAQDWPLGWEQLGQDLTNSAWASAAARTEPVGA